MQILRISDVGLSQDASHAFHSMLGIVQGRAAAEWQLSDPAQADVVLAPTQHGVDAIAKAGKAVVFVVEERNAWLDAPFVLRHPFRVMQLLSILDAVSTHLQPANASAPAGSWSGAHALRQLLTRGNTSQWHVADGAHGERLWIGSGLAAATPATLAALRAGGFKPGAFVPTAAGPHDACETMPRQDAAWYVGLSASTELAPWLSATTSYRLRRWPDFGRIEATPAMLRLSAAAATAANTPPALAASAQLSMAQTHRFLNAASLAGLLVVAPHSATASRSAPAAPGSWTRLFGGLRRRLGMANA